ncbi:Monothiol glutaredoxin-S14, chloroplastic [Auxenochlorella protothecoides]|uniref:Monothiol glutaredoxin-S14, chloroplastic n=1 Tax=Auxenochlorella protothecoides TaxID=3075 RepID=A0A087S9E8_AUXPR|nr:Monothiol glutaredoxin-S14, chloroplastic [Auxenochlorella protothecoides]KFM22352.1 Monothiol glutaredoxin-S14, chloroplastic [Auxenochlorella protothecoides]RMZ55640.1 hypothetical protein APUTEX25_000223 [Auxenochlorella protothecoides]|eukprot:RMZ55640.1 hypothetical protein APUTEX25_000223 [Auxenochlorella protothecoides]
MAALSLATARVPAYGRHGSLAQGSQKCARTIPSVFQAGRRAHRAGGDRRSSQRISAQAPTDVGLPPEFKTAIDAFVTENPVVAFIKGTKEMPQCGFSNTVVQILNTTGVPYTTVNILENDMLRSGMKAYSSWPTFPQIYIGGEFFGGCDIMIEAYTKGELNEALEAALNA